MHNRLPPTPPHAGLRIGSTDHDAVPVHLDGHAASAVVRPGPQVADRGRLRLEWADGRSTELDVRVRSVTGAGPVAEMDICGVDGDWQPFLEYVAHTRN